VFRDASLSNARDRAGLLAHPELLVFAGDGIAQGRTRVAATVTGQSVVGFASVHVVEQGQLELEDLFVDPRWRRCGIARRLVDDAARAARRAGLHRLAVTGNSHALAFYLSAGFIEVGQVPTTLGPAPRLHLDLDRHTGTS